MMRLTLVISSLAGGGAARVLSLMANHWAERGWPITLVTFHDRGEPPFFDLHPRVRHHSVPCFSRPDALGRARDRLTHLWTLRRAIRESDPQAVISFIHMGNVRVLLACLGLRLPVIVSERTEPALGPLPWRWRLLRRWLYPLAARIVVQTESARDWFPPAVQAKTDVIPNPVTAPPAEEDDAGPDAGADADRRTVLTMGRLVPVKGYERLLQAFAAIADRRAEWSLVVWGEGPLRADLEALRSRLGLDGRVFFPGRTREPFRELRRAALFVLTSRREGLPNALTEAMACGLPVVSFDCSSGVHSIIRDGVDGILTPPGDVRALASALDRLMGDPSERRRLAARAPDVLRRFGPERVMGRWEALLRASVPTPPVR